jgi:hypothetical protein
VIDIVLAHGLTGRADLPIPAWLFGWAAAGVLVVSFVSLGLFWKTPKLEGSGWRPLPSWLSRVATSRATDIVCSLVGVFLLGIVIWAGIWGAQSAGDNVVPTFIYVIFWVGLVPVSVLFGDVYRAFNPWRAIGRGVGWLSTKVLGERMSTTPPYPLQLGRWPAAAGLVAFAWLELLAPTGVEPKTLAVATIVYSSFTFLGMGLYGVEAWTSRGDAFSTYFGLFARISPFERRSHEVGIRRPLTGLTRLEAIPGTVALLAVMIGTVTFDGGQETSVWSELGPRISGFFENIGMSAALADELAGGVGMFLCIGLIGGFYLLGIAGARTVGGDFGLRELALEFVHSLVPIALVYVGAHYLTFLLFQGQAMGFLVSDPAGKGWDLFGTAGWQIDYGLIGATVTWYVQVAFVVLGHVCALALAHDRALVLYEEPRAAIRSQYWMLAVMIGFTSLALWLLSQANA